MNAQTKASSEILLYAIFYIIKSVRFQVFHLTILFVIAKFVSQVLVIAKTFQRVDTKHLKNS